MSGIVRDHITLNASGKSLGRLATEAARFLQGKHKKTWSPHGDVGVSVTISNLDRAVFTGRKMTSKRYYRHTNYPGNLKVATLWEKWNKNPASVFRIAVSKMLPKNKLRKERLKRLTIEL